MTLKPIVENFYSVTNAFMMRLFFFLIIISAFFGSYLYFFNDKVHLIRILPALLLLIYGASGIKLNSKAILWLSYFTIYFLYTLLISLINISKLEVNDILNLGFFYLFITALIISVQVNPEVYFRVFKQSIYVFIGLCLVVWYYEITTHRHLMYSVAANFATDYYFQPTTTFFVNPNDFAAIFTMCVMYLISILSYKSFGNKFIIALLIVAEIAICYTTKARVNFICFSVFLLFFFNLWKLKTLIALSLAFTIAFLITVRNQLDWQGLLGFIDSSSGSLHTRVSLYYYGLQSVFYNYGFGFGVMGHHYFYQEIVRLKIIDPHNFILELWIGSGVIITMLYIFMMLYTLRALIKEGNKLIIVQFVLYNFILLSSSSSLFLWPHYLFFIAYIFNRDPSHPKLEAAVG